MSNIAFIGLGNMGGPMAANLMTAGHSLTVFDLSEAAMQALAEKGARCASSALEAIEGAEVILSMLPAGKHVAGLYLGENGLIAKAAKGTLILDCSTIDAETARQVGAAAEAAGLAMLDAPVSGGVKAAQAGTLAFMCGGSEAGFVRAEKNPVGDGQENLPRWRSRRRTNRQNVQQHAPGCPHDRHCRSAATGHEQRP